MQTQTALDYQVPWTLAFRPPPTERKQRGQRLKTCNVDMSKMAMLPPPIEAQEYGTQATTANDTKHIVPYFLHRWLYSNYYLLLLSLSHSTLPAAGVQYVYTTAIKKRSRRNNKQAEMLQEILKRDNKIKKSKSSPLSPSLNYSFTEFYRCRNMRAHISTFITL